MTCGVVIAGIVCGFLWIGFIVGYVMNDSDGSDRKVLDKESLYRIEKRNHIRGGKGNDSSKDMDAEHR